MPSPIRSKPSFELTPEFMAEVFTEATEACKRDFQNALNTGEYKAARYLTPDYRARRMVEIIRTKLMKQ